MKKIISGLFVAVLLGAGLVGVSGGSATAVAPYPGTVKTFTHIQAPSRVERGHRARVCVRVTTNGNGSPKGRLDINFSRGRSDVSKRYTGGRVCVRTSHLHKPGKIRVSAHFSSGKNSVYKNSSDSTVIKVVRRHR